MNPIYCDRCGAKIPRLTEEPKIILGSFASITRGVGRHHQGGYHDWWQQSRQTVVSYRLCDKCADRLAEVLDGFVKAKE